MYYATRYSDHPRLSHLHVIWNLIACLVKNTNIPDYIEKEEENDRKDHFDEFISKYLSSFMCISLRSIDYFQVS